MNANDTIEFIDLQVRFEDLEESDAEAAMSERPPDPEDYDVVLSVSVVRLGQSLPTTRANVSLLLRPIRPRTESGHVIEARQMDDGSYHYVRTLESVPLLTKVLNLRELAERAQEARSDGDETEGYQVINQGLREGEVGLILARIQELGGSWEYAVGNLTVQVPLKAEATYDVRRLLQRLADALEVNE